MAEGRVDDRLALYVALRARCFDRWALEERRSGRALVELGCGLSTRFARLADSTPTPRDRPTEAWGVDLAPNVELGRRLGLEAAVGPDHTGGGYRLIEGSVLDSAWMDALESDADGPFFFVAEGLFPYIRPADVRSLVARLVERFPGSTLAFETIRARWTRLPLKCLVDFKLRRQLGFGPDAVFRSGLTHSDEASAWHPGVRFVDDWSWVDEDEERLGTLRHMRGRDWIRRFQWNVRYRFDS